MRISRLLLLCLLLLSRSGLAAPSVGDIMQRNFYATKVKMLSSTATMRLINDKGETRERRIVSVARLEANGVDASVAITFNTPEDVRGTRFLQIQHSGHDDDMWIFLPALHKTRRLVSANKHDSFVGTDFSYADILPLDPSGFHNTLLREEPQDGIACFVVESVAKDPEYVNDLGYSRRLLWIRKDDFIEARVEYYDNGGRLVKTQITAQHTLADPDGGRWVVQRREMLDHDSGHRTVITVDRFDSKTAISVRSFRVDALGSQ